MISQGLQRLWPQSLSLIPPVMEHHHCLSIPCSRPIPHLSSYAALVVRQRAVWCLCFLRFRGSTRIFELIQVFSSAILSVLRYLEFLSTVNRIRCFYSWDAASAWGCWRFLCHIRLQENTIDFTGVDTKTNNLPKRWRTLQPAELRTWGTYCKSFC